MDVKCPRCGTPSRYNPRESTSNQRKQCTACGCKFIVKNEAEQEASGTSTDHVELWEKLIIKQLVKENMPMPEIAKFHDKDEQWIKNLVGRWARLGLVPRTISNR